MFDDVAKFDGSILLDRTKGEAAGRCDSESASVLGLNMVHEIVTGKRSWEDARRISQESTVAYNIITERGVGLQQVVLITGQVLGLRLLARGTLGLRHPKAHRCDEKRRLNPVFYRIAFEQERRSDHRGRPSDGP
jgi:hypothetical protein